MKSSKRLASVRSTPTPPKQTTVGKQTTTGNKPAGGAKPIPNGNAGVAKANIQKKNGKALTQATKTGKAIPVPLSKADEMKREILSGKFDVECPTTAKVVRIFTSSTFTDTSHERNALMSRVYPKLKALCQVEGYEFQVVDMRWGVRDEATDNHTTTELCLRELKQCQKLSTGPNFVTFLSHKYGHRPVPRVIEAKEFETLLGLMQDEDDKACVSRWYMKDDNAVPSCYILQPVSANIPEFTATEEEKRADAKQSWNEESNRLREALLKSAEQKLKGKDLDKYIISVTEAEIAAGVLESEDVDKHCVWFKRNIKDIEHQEKTPLLAKFIDCLESEKVEQKQRQLLKKLTSEKLPKALSVKQIHKHEIDWTENGVDPAGKEEHKTYIDNLCEDFESTIKGMILAGIEERRRTAENDDVYDEVLQHTLFCQTKCQSFQGREDILEKIRQYILGRSRSPLVVHGQSGSGKTSIMAMAAKHAKSWIDDKGVVVLRFIGTTPDSTGIVSLLISVLKHILMSVNEPPEVAADLKDLIEQFNVVLSKPSVHKPFVILLDSLDQLDPSNGARQLGWLPKHLPPFVKIVVSTLPEAQYECFPRLQALVKDRQFFIDVPTLPDTDVSSILVSWLTLGNRSLTENQKEIVLDTFKQCPIPLFLKLSFDEACRWKSYDLPETTVLESTVRASIISLYERVEQLHGKLFVSRALGYLTVAKSGLTESELEDILSCDDDVLNDVYQYWTPPVRRLPPLLIVRMKADLDQYLVDRGADVVRVFYWYHRQFIEAAQSRYCGDPEQTRAMNASLADFFGGKWCGIPKPYTDKGGNEAKMDRFVAAQPLKFSNAFNLRKLNNLPHHLILGSEVDTLKKDVCLNLNFLLAKLKATSLRIVLDDFEFARQHFPEDPEIKVVQEALQLSQDALQYDPNELPCQLLGRIPEEKQSILSDPQDLPIQYLMPDKTILVPPGGQLVHCLAGHSQSVSCVDISSDGKVAVSASADKSIRMWDVIAGKLKLAIENVVEDPEHIQICADDKLAIVGTDQIVLGVSLSTGDIVYKLEDVLASRSAINMVACGKHRNTLVLACGKRLMIYDAATGKKLSEIENKEMAEDEFGGYEPISAQGMIVATATSGSSILRVADIDKGEFTHNKRMFPKPKSEDDDELSVDALAITPNKKSIVFSNYMDNDIHVCHLKTLARLRVIKGKRADLSEKFHISPDGSILYYPNYLNMGLVDLKSGKRSDELKHPNNISDLVSVDMKTVVSVAGDSVVRIWDLTREDPQAAAKKASQQKTPARDRPMSSKKKHTGKETDVGRKSKEPDTEDDGGEKRETEFNFRMLEGLPNSRYLVVYTSLGALQVYDLVLNKPVRTAQITGNKSFNFNVVDTKMAVVMTDARKVKLVDLDKMAVSQVFQGLLPKYNTQVVVRKNAKEMLTTSRGRKNIVVHSTENGQSIAVLKGGQEEKLDDILLSKDERWLAAYTEDEGPLLVFDVSARTCHFQIVSKDIGEYLSMSDSFFTPCGTYFLANTSRNYPGFDDSESYFLVISTETGKIVHHLLDVEYFKKYQEKESEMSVAVVCSVFLRDFLFMVGSDDRFIRVWNCQSGELLHRLTGHTHDVSELMASEDGRRFVSYSSYAEEEAFRLWDGLTFECLATFKGDNDIIRICMTSDGSRVVAGDETSRAPVTWRLEGRETNVSEPEGEIEFDGEQTTLTLNPEDDDDKEFDGVDLDTDVDEISDADEDSEDDTDGLW